MAGGRSDTELYRAGNPLREKESAVQGPSGRGALLWCYYSRQCLLSFEVSHQPTRPNRCGSASSTTCRSMHRAASGKFSPNKIVLKCPRNAIGLKSQIESCFQLERRRESIWWILAIIGSSPLSGSRRWFRLGTSRLSAGRLANRDSHVIRQAQQFLFAASIAERLEGNRPSGPAAR